MSVREPEVTRHQLRAVNGQLGADISSPDVRKRTHSFKTAGALLRQPLLRPAASLPLAHSTSGKGAARALGVAQSVLSRVRDAAVQSAADAPPYPGENCIHFTTASGNVVVQSAEKQQAALSAVSGLELEWPGPQETLLASDATRRLNTPGRLQQRVR